MSQLALTLLFALCISQCAHAAVLSNTITDVRALKSEVETALEVLKFYTENYLYELVEAQDNAKNEFETELTKVIGAAFDEIKNAAQKKGNTANVNKCVKAPKTDLDSLKATSPKIVEDCVESQEGEEVNNLFDELIDEISAAKKMKSFIEGLEKDAETSNGRSDEVEKKIPSVRASLDQFEGTTYELMENGGKIMGSVETQTKECSNKQLAIVHSLVALLKERALKCINQA